MMTRNSVANRSDRTSVAAGTFRAVWRRLAPSLAAPSLAAALLAAIATAGCGGAKPVPRKITLPENVIAHPPSMSVIVTRPGPTSLATSLRALGVRFSRVTIVEKREMVLPETPVIILDEEALVDEEVLRQYPELLRWTKEGGTLIILRQDPRTMQTLRARGHGDVASREVSYRVELHPAGDREPLLSWPNPISRADLDSLGLEAHQLAFGNSESKVLLAGNTQHVDSSATILVEPFGAGTLWYVGVPIAARAATGLPAEQKMLANLLTAVGPRREL